MRLLLVVQNYAPAYSFGGVVTKAEALATGLAGLGHTVTVATTSVLDRHERPSLRSFRSTADGVTVHYLGTWCGMGGSSLTPAAIAFAVKHVPDADVVLIIGLYNSLGPPIAFQARRKRVPYVVEPSGMLLPASRSVTLKRLYHAVVGRPMLAGARAIIVTSRAEWQDALAFGLAPERLFLRRNGADIDMATCELKRGNFRLRIGIREDEPLILWLGRIEPIKNLDGLIRALGGLRHLRWHLAIVGPAESPRYLSEIREGARNAGLADRVSFVEGTYGEEKLAALADATILTLVSWQESWGNVVQEAMAAGVPVVVTKTCGVSEILEDGGGIVVDTDPSAIGQGLERLLTDGGLYMRLRARLAAVKEELGWEGPLRQLDALFGRLIAERAGC